MLGNAFLAAIIPFFMWLYQKATKTNSPENKKLNITIFYVLFLIIGLFDISLTLITYIDYFEQYGNSDISEALSKRLAVKVVIYGVFIVSTIRSYKSKIGRQSGYDNL